MHCISKTLILVVVLVALAILTGCGGGGSNHPNWSVLQPQRTGVVPNVGDYNFVMKDTINPSIVVILAVVENSGKKFINLYHSKTINGWQYSSTHLISIESGKVLFYNGDIAPGMGSYPAEGFAISGSFVSPTRMEGEIEFATYGNIIGKTSFVAILK
jgi:hypothetical protein